MLLELFIDTQYVLLNYIVNHIPCWTIRKLFYSLSGIKIGKNTRIHMGTKVLNPNRIEIGENCIINEMCFLDGRGYLTIGDNVSLSIYTMILTASHDKNSSSFAYYSKPVKIGNNVWTGARALILEGSDLKRGSIIGAGSVFRGIAEENSLYAGVPAKRCGNRNLTEYYTLNFKPFFR